MSGLKSCPVHRKDADIYMLSVCLLLVFHCQYNPKSGLRKARRAKPTNQGIEKGWRRCSTWTPIAKDKQQNVCVGKRRLFGCAASRVCVDHRPFGLCIPLVALSPPWVRRAHAWPAYRNCIHTACSECYMVAGFYVQQHYAWHYLNKLYHVF
jgi:hypothetical protein